ncbi:antitoxin YefM [Dysgonomonas sp. PFB1-18]|uniref:type II toxin-antitoxin system Phd/YefM family antitoxin n=1 Tax=unclassified Dysgonomonas TaxID=2630389 RepID=UPI002474D4FA|nr:MULTISPECIES: type II toxin-antitoxin system prevent-host-death family antitoxin [unclassified Dysgonomonas]MDH6311057.1 antitoxin YefM [Dysgonomonas sp. PF1-14]MDH6341105.1 antitoxin YefM [Dysgonomonas sp. PF1-16]MDH6382558.1 antitoxin YefM [Dysgonomonas sp. PFB1-18]MDH6399908.1 antitoxin YefM [Dysgonomonas sp. PF1-23]
METASLSDFRANIKQLLDQTADSHEPLIVKRQQGEDIIVMSLSDYNSHRETVSLMSNPANAIKLMQSIEEHKAGKVINVSIDELDAFISK